MHPERPQRLRAIVEGLKASGVLDELVLHEPHECDRRWIESVHEPAHVQRIEQAGRRAPVLLDSGDTVMSPGTYRAACLAVGGALEAVDRVVTGEWRRAFVAARPPGHHAERNAAMGFCFFNQVAVAARYAQQRHSIQRVAIVDFDVHHGNGTQHIFETDPTVFYASIHQWPLYPGTGAAGERGSGVALGTTLNCPLPEGSSDREWTLAMERIVSELDAFAPELLLISAGFDAHRDDPIAGTLVTEEGYRAMTDLLLDLARRHCSGRAVSLLEGGYDLRALARSVETHVACMLAG